MAVSLRKKLSASWLGRLYRTDKVLFAICALFFSASIVSNLIALQSTPFFVWNMYSSPTPLRDTFSYYAIVYNDHNLVNLRHTWNEPEKTYLYSPLKYYLWMHAHGSVDPARSYLDTWSRRHRTFAGLTAGLSNTPASQQQFTAWLERYISGVTGVKVHSVCVLKKQVRFDAGGLPEELASDTVLSIH